MQTHRDCGIPGHLLYLVCHAQGFGLPTLPLEITELCSVSPSEKALGVFAGWGFLAPRRQAVMAPGSAAASPTMEVQPLCRDSPAAAILGCRGWQLCPTPGLIPENITDGSKQSRAWLADKNTSRQQDEICSNFSLPEQIQRQK